MDPNAAIRASAFAALREIETRHGPVVPASALSHGFLHEGVRIPFAAQQGIFRPRRMTGGALSIATRISASGEMPYDDEEIASEADSFLYRYRSNGTHSHGRRCPAFRYLTAQSRPQCVLDLTPDIGFSDGAQCAGLHR